MVADTRVRNGAIVSSSTAASAAKIGVIVLSSTGRYSSASVDVSPSPSADVSSTFGAAISNARVSVATERPADERIARRMYLPGGI